MTKRKSSLAEILSAVPEAVWTAMIVAVVGAVVSYFQIQAAAEVEKVRITLKETTEHTSAEIAEVKQTTNATHTLVNSASLVQLRLYAVAARRIATLTNDPADIEAAELAEKLAQEHQEKQDKVDRSIRQPVTEGDNQSR